METKSGIPMTPENRIGILKRAREILSSPVRWTKSSLQSDGPQGPQYCVLGACEQAAYDLGLAERTHPFRGEDDVEALGYRLGNDLSLNSYARWKYRHVYFTAYDVNDTLGYDATIQMLDGYIEECEAGAPREPSL